MIDWLIYINVVIKKNEEKKHLRPSLYKYAIPSFTAASKFPFSAALVMRPKTSEWMKSDTEMQIELELSHKFSFPLSF